MRCASRSWAARPWWRSRRSERRPTRESARDDEHRGGELALALEYVAALENGAAPELLGRVFTPDVVQEEFPNRLMPSGARRGLAEMRENAERGRQVMSSQRYEVLSSLTSGGRVALEVQWSGTLAVALGSLAAGDTVRARFGVFLKLRDRRIAAQHNYDCFDAF